jgi:hypothetical protein
MFVLGITLLGSKVAFPVFMMIVGWDLFNASKDWKV